MKKYDAVVIGAGNGGLVAAIRLLQGGAKTLLVEKHNLPGGFATSFRRGRFEFEASLHELNDFGTADNAGDVRVLFDELGVTDKIEWMQIPEAYRVLSRAEKLDATMPFGVDAFIAKMEQYVPGSRPLDAKVFRPRRRSAPRAGVQLFRQRQYGLQSDGRQVRQLRARGLVLGERSARRPQDAQKGAEYPQRLLVLPRRALRRPQLRALCEHGQPLHPPRRNFPQDALARNFARARRAHPRAGRRRAAEHRGGAHPDGRAGTAASRACCWTTARASTPATSWQTARRTSCSAACWTG